jgi:hypothetical protein
LLRIFYGEQRLDSARRPDAGGDKGKKCFLCSDKFPHSPLLTPYVPILPDTTEMIKKICLLENQLYSQTHTHEITLVIN